MDCSIKVFKSLNLLSDIGKKMGWGRKDGRKKGVRRWAWPSVSTTYACRCPAHPFTIN